MSCAAEERWQARLQKKAPRYSQALRTGLAETLALLGARPDRLIDAAGIRGKSHKSCRSFWTVRVGSAGLRCPPSFRSWPRLLQKLFLTPPSGT